MCYYEYYDGNTAIPRIVSQNIYYPLAISKYNIICSIQIIDDCTLLTV